MLPFEAFLIVEPLVAGGKLLTGEATNPFEVDFPLVMICSSLFEWSPLRDKSPPRMKAALSLDGIALIKSILQINLVSKIKQ